MSVFSANSSSLTVNGESVPGVQAIDYREIRDQGEIYALGSAERIAVHYGAMRVEGRLSIASASTAMDGLSTSGEAFQLVAQLRHGDAGRSVSFDECQMVNKEFSMDTGGAGTSVYHFTAVRMREEDESGSGDQG
jgi:hypothetical protein